MPRIVQRINNTKVSAADMAEALDTIAALPPEDRTDMAARTVCLIELFTEPGRHEVSARVAALVWRLEALTQLAARPEFKNWPLLPGDDGGTTIPPAVLEAAAGEPLIESGGSLAFDADRFLKRLLAAATEEGHG
jgi:hypothetical protein